MQKKSLSHEEKVQMVVEQVKAAGDSRLPLEFAKGSVSHLVPNPYQNKSRRIDIKNLCDILEINVQEQFAVAECGLTFSDLVKATLPARLVPYTVPELKTITVGGAVSGCSVEAMSYRYGGFHDSCLEYEVVTGTGEVLTLSPRECPDLFDMIHGSYGTLGIITKIKFKLHPAKPYVAMEYPYFEDFETFWGFLRERCEKADYDFVDAIIHGPEKFVVCLGRMVEEAPYVHRYDWLKIYYKSTLEKRSDYLGAYDYFFRYDTECHWLSRSVPTMESLPTRLLFGKFALGSTNMIRWSKRLRHLFQLQKRPDVVVDLFIPASNFAAFFDWYKRDFDYWPLWIVPYCAPKIYPWISDELVRRMDTRFFIDCAVYGKPNGEEHIDYSELLERKTLEFGGIKTLISRNHYAEETFWKIYSKPRYSQAKARLDPNNLFQTLYERFHPDRYAAR